MFIAVLLSIASTEFVQVKPVSDAVVWTPVLTPVDVALSSVGLSRAKLVTRLETETKDKMFALPKSASPSLWVYEWRGLSQYMNGSVKCHVNFDKAGLVESVRVSALKTDVLPFIGRVREVWPRVVSRPLANGKAREWIVSPKNASLWLEMDRLKALYAANAYSQLTSGYPGGGMELALNLSAQANGPHVQLQCWESAAYVASPKKVLNTTTGVYDNSVQVPNLRDSALASLHVISIIASSKPPAAKKGFAKIGFDEAKLSVSEAQTILASKRDEALFAAKAVALAIQIYAEENSGRLPSASNIEVSLEPFLKNRDSLRNFKWTFTGGALSTITSPDATELGFVQVATGRAVVYASMAVRWQARSK